MCSSPQLACSDGKRGGAQNASPIQQKRGRARADTPHVFRTVLPGNPALFILLLLFLVSPRRFHDASTTMAVTMRKQKGRRERRWARSRGAHAQNQPPGVHSTLI